MMARTTTRTTSSTAWILSALPGRHANLKSATTGWTITPMIESTATTMDAPTQLSVFLKSVPTASTMMVTVWWIALMTNA